VTEVPLTWVDAFTDQAFGGSPAAVCLLEGPADPGWMQALAAELGLSETAYVWPEDDLFSLRWFTPSTEVDLCGHATLAAAHALGGWGRCADGALIRFSSRSGILTARRSGDRVELEFPADPATATALPVVLEGVLHGPDGARLRPVAAARSGHFLVLELPDAPSVQAAAVDLAAVSSLPDQALILTAPGPGAGSGTGTAAAADYVLRVFGPRVGIDEDPVTGSAQCTLGPYWAERLGRASLTAAQVSARAGRLEVTVAGDRVGIAGRAVTVLRGSVAVGPS